MVKVSFFWAMSHKVAQTATKKKRAPHGRRKNDAAGIAIEPTRLTTEENPIGPPSMPSLCGTSLCGTSLCGTSCAARPCAAPWTSGLANLANDKLCRLFRPAEKGSQLASFTGCSDYSSCQHPGMTDTIGIFVIGGKTGPIPIQ